MEARKTTEVGNLKAEWGPMECVEGYTDCQVMTSSVTISWASPIKYIKVTGVTKDGSCMMWQKIIMDKYLGDSTMAQLLDRVEIMLKDKGLYNQYWITYKIPTDEEVAELDPLTMIYTKP